ncbi:MAG: [FeFe] hydrogenase H-cluster maturation GTPase HydF [Candidatus Muiribacteriota bacterium]
MKASKGNRLHIAIFGRRNVGKSSLINAVTNQEIALVSDVAGTTTDPVFKAMEILPVGPVSLIDTAGLDDIGDLGEKRIKRTKKILRKTDLALLVVGPDEVLNRSCDFEKKLLEEINERQIPVILVLNKIDIKDVDKNIIKENFKEFNFEIVKVSAQKREGIEELKKAIASNKSHDWISKTLVGDLIDPGDMVVLVVPIDNAAPKGRLILPQVQVLRDILDNNASAVVVKDTELEQTLKKIKKPSLVITDSQAFEKVSEITPENVRLTSFSILFARYKGDLDIFKKGIEKINMLKDDDKILVAEACTHHVQSDDIGRYKIPRWLREKTGKKLQFSHVTGGDFPQNLKDYALVIHCGACMINKREMMYRLEYSEKNNVPIVNYGLIIAYIKNIFERASKALIK